MVWLWGGGFGLPCQRICLCGHACKWDVNTILILDNVISYAWTFSKFWGFSTEFKLKLILYKIIFGVHFFSLAFSDPLNIFLNWFITYLSDSTKDMFSINDFFEMLVTICFSNMLSHFILVMALHQWGCILILLICIYVLSFLMVVVCTFLAHTFNVFNDYLISSVGFGNRDFTKLRKSVC